MRAGTLRERVIVHKDAGTAANDDGHVSEVDSTQSRVWASVLPATGNSRFANLQLQADVTFVVRMRYDTVAAAIRPAWWITRDNGTRLNVLHAYDPTGRRAEIELLCNERVGA